RGRGGIELDASRHLALRAGLDDSRATAGFGVAWKRVVFDAAMRSHETLGASYVVSLRYSLASGEVSRVAP
ncbi:MAG: hypothetical protein OEY69_09370, partial [Candidatus Krumholzibacteria bacterium]|nr:hypothetical protein [Candidatus Krumholzibacteria bacterium]